MGENTVKALGAVARRDVLMFEPEQLRIVKDPKSALFDNRSDDVPDSFVLDIKLKGIKENVIIRRAGLDKKRRPILEVVDGRKRVRAALAVNRMLKKAGSDRRILVPCTLDRGSDLDLMAIMIGANAHRVDTTPMEKARQLQKFLAFGGTEAEAEIHFGVSRTALREWLRLLELGPAAQAAIGAGTIKASAAKTLIDLPHEEQAKTVATMIEKGATTGRKAKETIERAKEGHYEGPATTSRVRSRQALERARDAAAAATHPDAPTVTRLLRYILGEDGALGELPNAIAAWFAPDAPKGPARNAVAKGSKKAAPRALAAAE